MLYSSRIKLQVEDSECNNGIAASEVVKIEYEECETIGAKSFLKRQPKASSWRLTRAFQMESLLVVAVLRRDLVRGRRGVSGSKGLAPPPVASLI